MDVTIIRAVERAITAMHEHLGEQVTIDDMARAAMFSKFHFSRLFQRVTGVSPGRFLSALRIEEAKRLLLRTSTTVADIGHTVGYNSIGTFSSRFSSSVGVSPIAYRHLGGVVTTVPVADSTGTGRATTVLGHAHGVPAPTLSPIFIGLFPGPIPEGPPVRYTVLRGPGSYTLPNVPEGTWFLAARTLCRRLEDCDEFYVGSSGPVRTESGITARFTDIRLHPMRIVDPPHLLALPELTSEELLRVAG